MFGHVPKFHVYLLPARAGLVGKHQHTMSEEKAVTIKKTSIQHPLPPNLMRFRLVYTRDLLNRRTCVGFGLFSGIGWMTKDVDWEWLLVERDVDCCCVE